MWEIAYAMNFEQILPEARRREMIDHGFWQDRLLSGYLDEALARVPEKTAIVDWGGGQVRSMLSYREYGESVRTIAANLLRLGIRRGDVVSCQLPNWWEFSALIFACARIGAVINPMMPIFRYRELSFMLRFARSRVFVTPRRFRGFDHQALGYKLREELPDLETVVVVGGEGPDSFCDVLLAACAEQSAEEPISPRDADDVMQLLFTSGTTGEPKGVMHTSNTLLSIIPPYIQRLQLGADDRIFMPSPLAHQIGFMYGVLMPVMLGATAVLQDVWDPKIAARIIESERATYIFASTPFLADLTEVAETGQNDLSSIRVFHSAGAPIPRILVTRATQALDAAIVSGWGMTENGAVTITRPDDPPEKIFHTDGVPLEGMAIRVVDETGKPLLPDHEGRLQTRGCSNFVGYLKRPEYFATDEDGWFETGDLARIDSDGYVRITGRQKDIVIRGGENIPIAEIEELLYRHPSIQEVAIVGMPDARLGERACAFIVPKPGSTLHMKEMVEYLTSCEIAKSYLPERLELVDEMPRTASGKIQKFVLRARAAAFATAENLS